MQSEVDPTARFSDRVANYVRYRPGYPETLCRALEHELGIASGSVVADVGSGTGISTELLLRIGCRVYAIEPNADMRREAEARFEDDVRFHSVAARAEATTLPEARVDAVTAGQAFHWFNVPQSRAEFARILRPAGIAAVFWNTRKTDGSPFLRAYEQLLQEFGTDYRQVNHRNVDDEALSAFFGPSYQSRIFANEQDFDYDGLRGRLLSSSYVPVEGHPRYEPMLSALRRIFDEHQEGGKVHVEYDTELFFGPLHFAK
jgi:SAM-dependent methyltransferase